MKATAPRDSPETDAGGRAARARQASLIALAAGAGIHLVFLASLFTGWLDPLFLEARGIYGQASDYFGIYQAGDNLTQGRSIYLLEGREVGSPRRVPYFYFYRYLPPAAYVAAAGAWFFTPWTAYWLWVAVNEALLLLLLASLLRRRGPPEESWKPPALAALALSFTPFYLEQWMGQFSFLMAVFLWFTFIAEIARPPRPGRASPGSAPRAERGLLRQSGFWCWSGAVTLKNFPALFGLVYLRQGRWRRVALAAAAVIVVCLPYYAARPRDLTEFLYLNLRPMPPQVLGGSYGLASLVRDLGWRLPDDLAGRLIAAGPLDVYVGNVGVLLNTALVVGLALWATWRMRPGRPAVEGLALWVATFFLIYKDIWEYHYVMLLPVIFVLALRGSARWPLLAGILLALPTPFVLYRETWGLRPVGEWPAPLAILHYASKALPAAILYVTALTRTLREESSEKTRRPGVTTWEAGADRPWSRHASRP